MGDFSYWATEISADKSFVFCIAEKMVMPYDIKPSAVSVSWKTNKKTPERFLLSLQRAEFVSASAKNLLNGIPGHTGTPGHVSTFLLVGGELLAYVSGFPVQEISLALEATSHSGRKEEDSGLFTW